MIKHKTASPDRQGDSAKITHWIPVKKVCLKINNNKKTRNKEDK